MVRREAAKKALFVNRARKPTFRLCLLLTVLLPFIAFGQTEAVPGDNETTTDAFTYGSKGLQYSSVDGNNLLWFGIRLQARYSSSQIFVDELPGRIPEERSTFAINRGRFKLGGHLFDPAFEIYSEYDVVDSRLLDLRATYKFADWLSLRVGQWKAEFNRERIDSSGAQQFVERSVVTPWFTIDRQRGVMASGRISAGRRYDSSYWVGYLSGAGRGGDVTDADGLWLGRFQWNFTGRVLPFSQSDISRRKPAGSVAVALVSGRSAYTGFSSAGGGQLPGFADGGADRYRIEQLLVETAYQSGGFSWQQELHWKTVKDTGAATTRRLLGGYAQAGYFLHERWASMPQPLELALRYARVDPDRSVPDSLEREWTMAANWFFKGHRNKLTADLSSVRRVFAPETDKQTRFRMQWDVSF
jgi:phosphate-selective porin OprO/OprP